MWKCCQQVEVDSRIVSVLQAHLLFLVELIHCYLEKAFQSVVVAEKLLIQFLRIAQLPSSSRLFGNALTQGRLL